MKRRFETLSSFPLLTIGCKESKKQLGFTKLCVLALEEIRETECDDTEISRNYKESKKYIWCNYKERISPVTVMIDDESTIRSSQIHHENVSKLLPKMREIKKRQ